jgi:hypothetical protein
MPHYTPTSGVLFLLATPETFAGTARHILGAKRCCPTALVSLQPKREQTVLVSRGSAESQKWVLIARLLRTHVDRLFYALFAGGRDLSPSIAGSADRSFVL